MRQFRTIDEARVVAGVALDELDAVRDPARHILALEDDVLFRLSWADRPRCRTRATGLVGYCRVVSMCVHPATAAAVRPQCAYAGDVKVHFCGHKPCRACFDGVHTEIPVMHVVALGSLGPGDALDLGAWWKGVASVGIAGAPSGDPGIIVPRSHAVASRLRVALPCRPHSSQTTGHIIDLCYAWQRMGTYLGLLAFFVYAYLRNCPVHVYFFALAGEGGGGFDVVDVVNVYGPWAVSDVVRLSAAPRNVLACISTTDELTGNVNLRLATISEIGSCNHYMPIVRHPGGAVVGACEPAHPPCDGTRCGGRRRDPCMAQLVAELAARGWLPLENLCQGDCSVAVMASWDGGDTSLTALKHLRMTLSDALRRHSGEARWHLAFALSGEANSALAGEANASAALHSGPALALPAHTGEANSALAGKANASAAETLAIVPVAPGGTSAAFELNAAVAWRLGMNKPPDHLVALATESLDDAQRVAVVEEYRRSLLAEPTTPPPKPRLRVKRNRATRRKERLANGECAATFFRERNVDPASELPRGEWAAFREFLGVKAVKWAKPDQMYWHRAMREYLEKEKTPRGCGPAAEGYRKRNGQGRPSKATVIREQLFEWFCERRQSVKGRLPLRCLWDEATRLRDLYVLECLRQGRPCDAPMITYKWLRAWRKEYGVSLRRPNQRWKVPRPVLKERLWIMWSNLLRVQTFLWLNFGYFAEIDGFDQKPMHVAEGGSKLLQTLAFVGEEDVALKENHSATRNRWTLTTWVTNSMERALAIPPLECCFKGGVRVNAALASLLSELRAGGLCGDWLSLVATDKGSYKAGDIYRYLDRHLEPWGPTRRWRILFCDAYSAHDSHEVRKLCWSRGYIMMYHGGGTTGVAQVNDTDLHYFISQMYLQCETLALHEVGELFTHRLATRSKVDMVTDVIAIWKNTSLHLKARDGHFRNGLCQRVDGADESKIDRLAREFWDELQMDRERETIVKDLSDEWSKGNLHWSYASVRKLIRKFPAKGFLDEYKQGQEDEGGDELDDEPGAPLWNDNGEPSSADEDESRPRKRLPPDEDATRTSRSRVDDSSAVVPHGMPEGLSWWETHTFKVARTNALEKAALALGSRGVARALRREQRRLAKVTEEWKAKAPLVYAVRLAYRTKEDTLMQDRKRARMLDQEAAKLKAREAEVRKKEQRAAGLQARARAAAAESEDSEG